MPCLSKQAFDALLKPRSAMPGCRAPNFPNLDAMEESACKRFLYCKTPTFLLIVDRGMHEMLCAFQMQTFSNFVAADMVCTIKEGVQCGFRCGEQAFKAACALLHLDPRDDALRRHEEDNLKVLDRILHAEKPSIAKTATMKLKGFKREEWDRVSFDAMYWAQLMKLQVPEFRDFIRKIARIAQANGVEKARDCLFAEATDDAVWGTGVGVQEIFDAVLKEESGIYTGRNGLGKAIAKAFVKLMGDDFEHIDEEWGASLPFFFELEEEKPALKRTCSLDDDEEPAPKRTCSGL
jgi:predicted NAD-dependent protein-ADP-ribosyltransferase YbiA (DUF1768 family)